MHFPRTQAGERKIDWYSWVSAVNRGKMDRAAENVPFSRSAFNIPTKARDTAPGSVFYRVTSAGQQPCPQATEEGSSEGMRVGMVGGMDSLVGQLRVAGMPPASQISSPFDL